MAYAIFAIGRNGTNEENEGKYIKGGASIAIKTKWGGEHNGNKNALNQNYENKIKTEGKLNKITVINKYTHAMNYEESIRSKHWELTREILNHIPKNNIICGAPIITDR